MNGEHMCWAILEGHHAARNSAGLRLLRRARASTDREIAMSDKREPDDTGVGIPGRSRGGLRYRHRLEESMDSDGDGEENEGTDGSSVVVVWTTSYLYGCASASLCGQLRWSVGQRGRWRCLRDSQSAARPIRKGVEFRVACTKRVSH